MKNTGKYFSLSGGAGLSYGGYGFKAQINTSKKLGFHLSLGTLFSNDLNANIGIKFYPYNKWWYLGAQTGYLMYKDEYPGVKILYRYFGTKTM